MENHTTILLVDDDLDDCLFFMEAINHIDPSIVGLIAHNGFEAIDILKDQEIMPSVIFADMNMPKMNGPEFVVEIYSKKRCPNTPIILYSTAEIEEWHQSLAAAGVTDFLVKEFSVSGLRKQLQAVLHKHGVLQESPSNR